MTVWGLNDMRIEDVSRVAAFADGDLGGNPAGVAFVEEVEDAAAMLRTAAAVGYSETAFLAPQGDAWRVRYFAPETEVPFCGHATIALGSELGRRFGPGLYRLVLNEAEITVEAIEEGAGRWGAVLQSPATWSKPLSPPLALALMGAFDLTPAQIDPRLPISLAHAGANHAVIPLASRARLAAMAYEFEPMKQRMLENDLTTISLIHFEAPRLIHARNPFAVGGVYEDPATGAAAAALGGLLRDLDWDGLGQGTATGGPIEIRQGFDMGVPSRLRVEFGSETGSSIGVSGLTREISA
ncbi:MAG: PhzF family phenazine biosynthesis isomerase [Pseudomonadota bacterium]